MYFYFALDFANDIAWLASVSRFGFRCLWLQDFKSKLGFSLALLVLASVSGLMLWQDRGASSNGSS